MTREPSIPPPPVVRTTPLVEEVRRYKVITPIFGGGVNPSYRDPLTPIRGNTVRGNLRFWWRACRGGSDLTDERALLEDMRSREAQVWGLAADDAGPRQSAVNLRVRVDDEGKEVRFDAGRLRELNYALFPMRAEDDPQADRSQKLREGVEFTLTLTYPERVQADVQAALWAWETFGGIGARTRRGCGALQCIAHGGAALSAPQDIAGARRLIEQGIAAHVTRGQWTQGAPHLPRRSGDWKLTGPHPDALDAWEHLIQRLQSYRQQRRGKYGRSRWPEPDAVRQRLLSVYGGRLPADRQFRHGVLKFPRGQFGLPIVFHLKDEPRPRESVTATLQGADDKQTRLASPLILRPLALGGGKACGLALLLDGWVMPHLVLVEAPGAHGESARWTAAEAANVQSETNLESGEDPLRYFLTDWL